MVKRCYGCMEQYDEGTTICPHCGYVEGTKAEEAIHMDPGTCLKDRYIIGRVLGYGGFGVTYIAWDQRLEQKVAVKEYLPSEFSTRMPGAATVTVFSGDRNEQFQQGLDKFVEEAKRLSKFQNEPGVVKIFDSFKENSTAYIIMEYLDGETLTAYLEREGLLTEEKAIEMLLPVMQSLQIVHEEGILHRDIAPDNIFITKAGEVKLIDFGASRYATTSHSRSLTVVIKPGYSPEEQYRSRGDQGAHTDVYALSATMYKMLTGITPPDALERRANIEQKKKDLLKDIHKLNKNVSRRTENAILNAMNVQIEDRTPNIQAFMDELYSEKPVARRYGKIKKIDVYAWPKWLKIGIPVCLIAFLLIGVLLLTGVLRVPSKYNDEVVIPDGFIVVPDVEGLNKDEALSAIADSGLIPRSEGNVISDYLEPGQIVLQTPVSGSYLEQNGIVNLTVSSGSAVQSPVEGKATVPYVIWDTLEMATEKLAQAGLGEPIVGESIYDDAVPKGSVIAQSEDVGTELPEGTQITLTISLGPKPFDMPNVVGMTWANAEKLLKDKGLNVSTTYENSSTVAENTVLRQDIAEKQQVCKGDKVTLTVSSGKPVIAVPNVVGKKLADAKTTLTGKKFKVEDYEMYHNTVPAGTVISQNPEAGTSQIEGTTIKVFVSKGKQPIVVSLDAQGGTVNPGSISTYLSDPYGSLPTPAKAGYTFEGWYSASNVSVSANTKITTSANHTLYAKWKANTYKVQFNANGGTGTVSAQSFTYGVSQKLTSNTFTRTNCAFLGWGTGSGTTTVVYKNGESVANLTTTSNGTVTLYAVWESVVLESTKVLTQQPTEIVLNQSEITLETTSSGIYDNSATLTATLGYSKPTASIKATVSSGATLTWSSNNTNVVTVNGGTITAVSPGSAVITAKTSKGSVATCTVTVERESNAVTWTSNSSAATVSGGVVKAVSRGNVTITARTANGCLDTCSVKIYEGFKAIALTSSNKYADFYITDNGEDNGGLFGSTYNRNNKKTSFVFDFVTGATVNSGCLYQAGYSNGRFIVGLKNGVVYATNSQERALSQTNSTITSVYKLQPNTKYKVSVIITNGVDVCNIIISDENNEVLNTTSGVFGAPALGNGDATIGPMSDPGNYIYNTDIPNVYLTQVAFSGVNWALGNNDVYTYTYNYASAGIGAKQFSNGKFTTAFKNTSVQWHFY